MDTAEGRAARWVPASYGPLLLIFAHPDDETFTSAGTVAAAMALGIDAVAISATRGEGGKTGIPHLDTPDVLGAVREQELRAAMAIVGVRDIRFLDYRDSGMAGAPENADRHAFMRAPVQDVVSKLVPHVRAVQLSTVITFGPDGLYGHPDHVAIHRAATAAVHAAADPACLSGVFAPWRTPSLYYATIPRERMQRLVDRPDGPLRDLPRKQRDRLGTPAAAITTVIDVSPHREVKGRAIAAHRTQTGEGGPLSGMPEEHREAHLSREHFVRVRLPWDPAAPAPLGSDLLSDLAATRPTRPA